MKTNEGINISRLEHIPPHDVEKENEVLGLVLKYPKAMKKAIEKLNPEDFYNLDNKKIFESIIKLGINLIDEDEKSINIVAIKDNLKIEGMEYKLADLFQLPVPMGSFNYLIDQILFKSRQRKEMDKATKKYIKALEGDLPSVPSTPSIHSASSKKELQIATFDGLVEIIKTENGLSFLMKDGLHPRLIRNGIVYIPPNNKFNIKWPTQKVMDWIERDEDGVLFDEIYNFIMEHVELPDEHGYIIVAAYIFHTWLIEETNHSPIIQALGPKGSGKSTLGEVIGSLAKRGVPTASLTGPALFRTNELYKPTFIIDEVNLWGINGNKDIRDMLNVRFQRGLNIIRCNPEKDGLESIETFDVFGPTVLIGTEEIPDTTRSRAIRFIMERNCRKVERCLNEEKAAEIRDRLCAFRFKNIDTNLNRPDPIVQDGRLDDVILPLHQMILLTKLGLEKDFISFCKSIELERIEEEFQSVDAEVVQAFVACKNFASDNKIELKLIVDKINEDRLEREQLATKTVGNILTRLGFKPVRLSSGRYGRIFNEVRLNRLRDRYHS